MNILFIKHFVVGFVVSEIPKVSVFGHCPYSVTFPYVAIQSLYIIRYILYSILIELERNFSLAL